MSKENVMNVYQRLNLARELFHNKSLKKSGENKFAGYKYFELGDFVVPALHIFKEVGLASVISFHQEHATMTIVNTDDKSDFLIITSPMSEANLKGCHPVQNLGAVQTYIRRYLWVAALEIVEHDALDSTTGSSESKEAPKKKEEPKKEEVIAGRYVAISPKHKLFVDSMEEWGASCTSLSELTELWKANQTTIDKAKSGDKEQYKRLVAMFGELKSNFKE
jgi:hypothetical protein